MAVTTKSGQKIAFGTDGIRAELGQNGISPSGMLEIGWAFGIVLAERTTSPTICVATDTRASANCLENALISGFVAAGVHVERLGVQPTPVVPFWIRHSQLSAGVMLTASHNKAKDNGIKLFNALGEKISSAEREALIKAIDNPCEISEKTCFGQIVSCQDAAAEAYTQYVIAACAMDNQSEKVLHVVIDPGYGAASLIAEPIFKSLGYQVSIIHTRYDGYNINCKSGSTSPEVLQEEVINQKADYGIAFDGDADRVIIVDAKGRLVDGDNLLFILALTQKTKRKVVITPMSNQGLTEILQKNDIEVVVAPVGDQNVYEAMKAHSASFGAEPNGHVIIGNINQSGDGIMAAATVLKSVHISAMPLVVWVDKLVKYPQRVINIPFHDEAERTQLYDQVTSILDKAEHIEASSRFSGTEPMLRVLLTANPGYEQNIERVAQDLQLLGVE